MIGLYTGGSTGRYCKEILSHAGLAWQTLSETELCADQLQTPVILLCGTEINLAPEVQQRLERYVADGGVLIAIGGSFGIETLLGVEPLGTIDEGYLAPHSSHPLTSGLSSSLHFFGGVLLRAAAGSPLARLLDTQQRPLEYDALVLRRHEHGLALTIAADIPGSVWLIQHGRFIGEDGVPAPDGTAPIDDGILKTDDGSVLSWVYDRQRRPIDDHDPESPGNHPDFPAGDTPWFTAPIADELRTLLLRAVLWTAARIERPVPLLWYWPRGLSAVGLISHDSDLNIDASARLTLDILKELDIRSTWCMQWGPLWPDRYLPETYRLVAEGGHEVALHYNALPADGGRWSEDDLHAQLDWLRAESGIERVISNKNHYLRWEGRLEFFHWLERAGIESDQSKGPSKKGNVGFLHGSCHPWLPYDPDEDRFLNVLEIPLHTQDLWLTAPPAIAEPILQQARTHHGVAHFLFHQVHLYRHPQVVESLRRVVERGRALGLEWWTGAEINAWERLRRQVCVRCYEQRMGWMRLEVVTPAPLPAVSLVVPLPGHVVSAQASAVSGEHVASTRLGIVHGLPALFFTLDLPAGRSEMEVRYV